MGNCSLTKEKEKCLKDFRDILLSRGLIAWIVHIGDIENVLRVRLKKEKLYIQVYYYDPPYVVQQTGYVISTRNNVASFDNRGNITIEKDVRKMMSRVNAIILKSMNMKNISTQYLLFEDRRQQKIDEYLDNHFPGDIRNIIKIF